MDIVLIFGLGWLFNWTQLLVLSGLIKYLLLILFIVFSTCGMVLIHGLFEKNIVPDVFMFCDACGAHHYLLVAGRDTLFLVSERGCNRRVEWLTQLNLRPSDALKRQ